MRFLGRTTSVTLLLLAVVASPSLANLVVVSPALANPVVVSPALANPVTGQVARSSSAEEPFVPHVAESDAARKPDDAHGQEIRETEGGGLLWIPRVLLFIPRWALTLINYPIQGAVYVVDRFELPRLVEDVFFDDTRTYGLVPTAFIETGFGLNIGAHFTHRNLFGQWESLRIDMGFGGRFSQNYRLRLDTGDRFGPRWRLMLDGGFEAVPNYFFFGIGSNPDEALLGDVNAPIDPYADDTAVRTATERDQGDARLRVMHKLSDRVALTFSGSWRFQTYDDVGSSEDDPGLFDVYDPVALRLVSDDLHMLYGEVDFTYDSRRPAEFVWPATPSTGWRGTVFIGYNRILREGATGFARGGLDLVRNWDLYKGTRVLVTRLYTEAVTGPIEEIPIFELPALGGPTLLRGHFRDRYRDQAVAMVSAQYNWILSNTISTFLFVDAGRAFRRLDGFFEDDAVRVGFGGGIQFQNLQSVLGRLQFAASTEGDFLFALQFDRGDEVRPRTAR